MRFPIGTKVRLRFTGESGTIVMPLGHDMVLVRLDSDPKDPIPTFEEDLEELTVMNKFAAAPKSSATPPPLRVVKAKSKIEEAKGIQLVFEPMPGRDETVTRYKAWLVNDTPTEFLFELDVFVGEDRILSLDGKLEAETAYEVGDLQSDDLNDSPEVELAIWRITTQGKDEELFKTIKIRPKQFMKNHDFAPIVGNVGYIFVIFDKFDPVKQQEKEDGDLKAYTKQAKSKAKPASGQGSNSVKYEPFNLEAIAAFVPEIDLHIHALMNGHTRIDKGEILRIQMKHLEIFMDRAQRMSMSRVFIIHGIGEGKLKETVAQRLREMHFVRKFKNEYHHKYGYGATEVWLD